MRRQATHGFRSRHALNVSGFVVICCPAARHCRLNFGEMVDHCLSGAVETCSSSRSAASSSASDDDDSDSGSEPWYDDVLHGAEDVGKAIVHGDVESAELLREAAEKSLELAAEHRQALEMAAFLAVQFIPGVDEAVDAGLLIDEAIDAGEDAAEAEEDVEEAADSCTVGGQSFTAGTMVLLASGAAIPISQLKVGEKVLATSTKTGKTQPEAVAAVLVHHDTDLYDLKIRGNGGTSVIDTTSNHLFWVPGTDGHAGQWVKAGALRYGTHLRTVSGDTATVVRGWVPKVTAGWMWDLTIPRQR